MGARKRKSYLEQKPEEPAIPDELQVPEWPTAIYARLSIENSKKDDHGESIEGQIEICRDYVEEHPYLHLAETYVDNGWTGTNTNRPAFQQLLQDIEERKIRALVIKDFSRFSRDYIEAGNLLENVFPIYGIRFISVADHYDSFETDGTAESLLIPLKNLINDYYSRDISRKVSTAVHARQLAGEHIPSMIPYGYRKSTTQAYRFEPDPETASVVKRIFQMRLDGIPLSRIAKLLQAEGIPSPGKLRYLRGMSKDPTYENARWNTEGLRQILCNPTYLGDLVFGRTPTALYLGKPKYHHERDESKWRVLKGMHEPLVSQEVFNQVKAMTETERQKHAQQLARTEAYRKLNIPVFHDCLFCGDCGRRMHYQRDTYRPERLTGNYNCRGYPMGKCSSTHTISQEKLKTVVWQSIQDQLAVFCDYDRIPGLLEGGRSTERLDQYQRDLKSLQVQMSHRAERREHLYEDFTDGILTPEEYMFMKTRYDEEYQNLKAQIQTLQGRLSGLKRMLSEKNQWLTHIRSFIGETEFRPEMLEALVEKILVYQEESGEKRVEICYNYHMDFEALQQAFAELHEGGAL